MIIKSFARILLLVLSLFWTTFSFAQPAYKDTYLEKSQKELLTKLEAQTPRTEIRTTDELLSAAKAINKDLPQALILYGRAVLKSPTSHEKWMFFAVALQQKAAQKISGTNRVSSSYEERRNARIAAYAAYQYASAKGEKAAALWLLGATYEFGSQWTSALEVYNLSLAFVETTAGREHYQKLREEHGFRVTGYKVNAKKGSPTVCFDFSSSISLSSSMNWSQYVRVEGTSNLSILREDDNEICVNGLDYGRTYVMTLREGLPSKSNEALFKDYRYEVQTSDREPSLRFTGKNYVLPSVGQEGIPIVTINHSAVDIEILRIGDRNLVNTLSHNRGNFLEQISTVVRNRMKGRLAAPVWKGNLSTENARNTEVITAFPISEAVKKFEPGVYVMVAKPIVQGVEDEQDTSSSDHDDEEDYYGSYEELATQWFIVSDLGVTAFTGEDGVHVLVNSLASAKPIQKAKVALIARSNEILATREINESGYVSFDPGLSRGMGGMEPNMVVVTTDDDYAFLDLSTSAFDLTDRGVKGSDPIKSQDAFLYTERGVYRPGETVNLTALMRDHRGIAIEKTPLIIKAYRPDGVEFRSFVTEDQGQGGRVVSIALLSGASRGTWTVSAFTDPKMPAIGTTSFSVEDYVPDRLKIELTAKNTAINPKEGAEIDVQVNYLFGAPGVGLDISGQAKVSLATGYPGYEAYSFGLADEEVSSAITEIEAGNYSTDDKGQNAMTVPISDVSTTRPLKANIRLEVSEDGGRAVHKSISLPIQPKIATLGIQQQETTTEFDESASFDVVLLNTELKRQAAPQAKWTLYRVRYDYQWYRVDGRWKYEGTKGLDKLQQGTVAIAADKAGRFSVPTDIGYRYQLEITTDDDEGTVRTTMEFSKGWFGDGKVNTPDRLEIALDKDGYDNGDIMKVRVTPRVASEVFIAIVSDKVYPIKSTWIPEGGAVVEIPATSDWGAGAYLVALSHRPLDQKAKHQPDRAIGLSWFHVAKAERTLGIAINTEELARPSTTTSIPIKVSGLEAGEEAQVTIALIDNGILSLTNYLTPDPVEHYYGQRSMGSAIRDLYTFLIDGMQGNKGSIRSGGDENPTERSAPMPGLAQEPLVRFSGIVKTDENGSATISFDLPEFNGSGRIMAVAWTKNSVGSVEKDLTVRDKVVMAGTLPRFLMIGDETQFTAAIHNVEGAAGDYVLEVEPRGPVLMDTTLLRQTIKLEKSAKAVFAVPFKAGGVGEAWFDVTLSGPDGFTSKQTLRLAVIPGSQSRLQTEEKSLKPGATYNVTSELTKDVIYGTGAVSVALSPVSGFDVPALLSLLDRYPHGCTEQTTSRALPLLYVNELSATQALGVDENLDERIRQAILRILARQSSNGSFGMWSASGDHDIWLNAYVADFLTRASERGFDIPRSAIDKVLNYLRNDVANAASIDSDAGVAYAAYVLARNGQPVIGDLRYMAESRLARLASPLSKAHVAAGLALLGDEGRAKTAFQEAMKHLKEKGAGTSDWRSYGSQLRDISAMLALSYESPSLKGYSADIVKEFQVERKARVTTRHYYYTSTQENTWMVLAARSIMENAKSMTTKVNGKDITGIVYRNISDETLAKGAVSLENTSSTELSMAIGVTGSPITPLPASSNGLSIERNYYTIEGEALQKNVVTQNDRMVVVLTVTLTTPDVDRLILSDFLPAGLELENPKLGDQDGSSITWLKDLSNSTHVEHRDDRFTVAFGRRHGAESKLSATRTFRYAYSVRAVSPGRYLAPAAEVEVMYSPHIFGRTSYGRLEVLSSK